MADAKLHNWDFVGRCYDALKLDPLNLEAGVKLPTAFDMADFDDIPDGRFQKPKCTDYRPATGGQRDSTTVSLSSSYDFHRLNKIDGSVSVSDPTGDLFATTLSTSYTQTRDATESRKSVVTLTRQTVNAYGLALKPDQGSLKIEPRLAEALQALPATDGPEYKAFLQRFGTHYARSVLFGGRLYQRIVIQRSKYSSFLEEGIDVQAEAKATFEIAKVGVMGHAADTRNQKFVSATKNTSEAIVWTGGVPNDINSWASSVADQPAPIQVELRPLYDLLSHELLPAASGLEGRRALLQAATDQYLRSQGDNPSTALLQYGETVTLGLADAEGAPPRFLSAGEGTYARTSVSEDRQAPELRWTVVNADDVERKGEIRAGDTVALRSARTGRYLDAQAGSDSVYQKGDGLTAAVAETARAASARWKTALADSRARNELVDGDELRFQSQWRDADGAQGYLLGEVNQGDAAQRVYAFGRPSPPRGTIWRMRKSPA